tara:strand:+ start:239 stop:694 length:456 start_codon:yes stop_codon:yes gene_type:complete
MKDGKVCNVSVTNKTNRLRLSLRDAHTPKGKPIAKQTSSAKLTIYVVIIALSHHPDAAIKPTKINGGQVALRPPTMYALPTAIAMTANQGMYRYNRRIGMRISSDTNLLNTCTESYRFTVIQVIMFSQMKEVLTVSSLGMAQKNGACEAIK